jgi:outer membrane protein TolC
MRWPLMVFFAWLSFAAMLSAQTNSPAVRPISLKECVHSALLHNLDLQIERFTPEIARFHLIGTYGAYDPTFRIAAGQNYIDQPTQLDPKKPNPDFGYEMTTDSVAPSLAGELPTGLTYNIGASFDSLNTKTDFSFSPKDFLDYPPNGIRTTNEFLGFVGITLRQPLLKDFWIDSTREQIWVNKKTLKISELALRHQIMNIVTRVQLAYFDLIYAREGIRVQEQSLALARQLLTETRDRVKAGELPPLEATQAESQVQSAEANVTAAKQVFVEQEAALKNLVSDDFRGWADMTLEPTDTLTPRVVPLDRAEGWQTALTQRPDYLQAKVDLERRDIIVRYQFNQLFPSLDVVGSYGARSAQDSFEAVAGELRNFDHPSYSYGVVFSMPLGNQTARNRYKATRAERQQALLQFRKLEQDILVQVDVAVKAAESHFHRIDATRAARVFAEAALEAEQKKFVNGLSTGFIVLQYQQRLTDARSTELRALADYNKALAQLSFAEGATLDNNQLTIETH